ncbi:MAG: hypothetical protein SF052_12010 [Bacteroidia bacterium]|nr:hypothetical protein [Bacteroidia bacterium]
MCPKQTSYYGKYSTRYTSLLLAVVLLSACKPEGLINKVKYNGAKYVNTCETFTADITKLIQNNTQSSVLKVSEYDNSDFTYYYLEQGQYEIKKDTLYFRLAQDLEYAQYLDKGVAVHVNASYKAVDQIQDLEVSKAGDLGTLVVNREYYVANRKPFFLYKFPLGGKSLEGKQLMLSFAIAKYDKTGKVKQYFCETDAKPVGTAFPSCCSATPWQAAGLQSIIEIPSINVKDETYRYEGFTGTIDVMFQEGSFKLADDTSFSALLIQAFVEKYKNFGYKIDNVSLEGWASPGGKEAFNMKLSQQRAEALKKALEILNGNLSGLNVTAQGKGEDWERVKLLTQASTRLTTEQKAEVLAIANDASLTNDQKEAQLRKVKFWTTLVDDVLVKARHTFSIMDFGYGGTENILKRYEKPLPVASMQLEDIAKTVFRVGGYKEGKDVNKDLALINEVLTKAATPNLYAIRATYYLANDEYEKAFADLESASRFRDANTNEYSTSVQGYKVLFADQYTFDQKKELYKSYNEMVQKNPGAKPIYFNRAVLMDKIGFISGALTEYKDLFEGNTATAANLNNRGVAKMKTNMFTEAEADFKAAMQMDPKMSEPVFNLAIVSAYRGLTKMTIEYLDKAVKMDSKYKALIFNNPAFSVMSEDPRFEKYRN